MNKIKNLFVIILFALVAFSCSDILDKGPLDKYSENDVWKSTDLDTSIHLYCVGKCYEYDGLERQLDG